jgi:Flp pilus assembly protein TadD
MTALFCAAALLVAARTDRNVFRLPPRVRGLLVGGVLALSAFAFVGLIGNSALAASKEAVAAGDWRNAETEARKARQWMPWSPDPWRQLAEAQIGADDPAGARQSLRQAIAKDSKDWSLWLDYGLLSRGEERRRALARAVELNPLSPEIATTLDALRRTTRRG